MFETLKIIHILSLAVGVGGGMCNAIYAARAMPRDPALIGPISKLVSRIGLGAIVLLWITGFWMLSSAYDGFAPGLWFWLKMLTVAILTLAALTMQSLYLFAPARLPRLAPKISQTMMASSVLTVIFAVLAFG